MGCLKLPVSSCVTQQYSTALRVVHHQRRQMQSNGGHWMEGGYEVSRKTYLGSEEWLQTGSTQRYIHYVSSPAGLAAIITGEVGNSESQEIYYPVTDYLGSIIMLLDSEGNVVEERSYDAWGRLRNPSFWDDYQVNELAVTNRGYTFHEHLLDAGLINMNGRLYDPLTGRMLSPDNYVQSDGNPQNYNRYSYVLNNPLKYNDPSGEVIPALVAVALFGGGVNMLAGKDPFSAKGLGRFAVGFATGLLAAGVGSGISAAIAGKAAGGGFIAGFTGKASAFATGVGPGALSGLGSGFTGGFLGTFGNELLNGASGDYALHSALRAGAVSGLSGAVIGGLIGGLQSKKYGGKFWKKGTKTIEKVDRNIEKGRQTGPNDCLCKSGEVLAKERNVDLSEAEIREHFGGNGPIKNEAWGEYMAKKLNSNYGYKLHGDFDQADIFSEMATQDAQVVLHKHYTGAADEVQHALTVTKATKITYSFAHAKSQTVYKFKVIDTLPIEYGGQGANGSKYPLRFSNGVKYHMSFFQPW